MKEREETRSGRRAARRLGERLSYANVMSTIAVFGLLAGGGAYAASKIGPKDIAKNAVRAKHIKKQQVKPKRVARSAIRTKHLKAGSVGSLQIQDGAVSAEKLAAGASAGPPTGPAGGDLSGSYPNPTLAASLVAARAFGQVSIAGGVNPGTERNLTASNITHPETGRYCLHDLPFDPTVALVTPRGATAPPNVATVDAGGGPACPAGTQFTVLVQEPTSGDLKDAGLMVVIF